MSKMPLSEVRDYIREVAQKQTVDVLPEGFNAFTKLYIKTLIEEAQMPAPLIVPSALAHYQSVTRGLSLVHKPTDSSKKKQ